MAQLAIDRDDLGEEETDAVRDSVYRAIDVAHGIINGADNDLDRLSGDITRNSRQMNLPASTDETEGESG